MDIMTSCIHTRAVIDCLDELGYRQVDSLVEGLDPLIDQFPDPVAYLKDSNHWVSWEVMASLLERARFVLGDDTIACRAAWFFLEKAVSPNENRIRVQYLWPQWRLVHAFSADACLWNRTRKVILERIGRNEARVYIRWETGVHATRDMCLYEQGMLTFMPLVWASEHPFVIEEVSCVCEGASHCEYLLRWPAMGPLREKFLQPLRIDNSMTAGFRQIEINRLLIEENARLSGLLRKRTEEVERSRAMLGRAQKLSFLGNMAARIAHEIRNPLAAIATFAQMLPEKYHEDAFRTEFKEIALGETTRINNLLTEFLDLAKPRKSSFERLNLHELIDKMVLLLSPRIKKKGIKVYRNYGKEVGDIVVDEQKIKQVVLNILSNAVEALRAAGYIRISTGSDVDSKGRGRVWVEVRDNGCGIEEGQMGKIFEPYWSTKEQGPGSGGAGLGLFIARQNMEDHRGGIEVLSRPNRGAAFVLRFPRDLPCSSGSDPAA